MLFSFDIRPSTLMSTKWSLPFAFLISPSCAICPVHLTLLDVVILIVSAEEYMKSQGPLCSEY